jgi:hypothetical protein
MWKGARHVVYAGAFARKTASPKNPKGLSSDYGRRPVIDHLHVPVVLSSSRSTLGNKFFLRKVQGVPKAPAKDQRLMSNPHQGASMRRCTKHPQEDSPRSRKAKYGRITEDQHLMSNPCEGARMRRCTKHPQKDSPRSRKAKRGRIIKDQGRSDHLAKETQIRRSAPGPSPREQPLMRCRRSLGSLKRRRFRVREGPTSLNNEEGPVNRHARQFALSCWHR